MAAAESFLAFNPAAAAAASRRRSRGPRNRKKGWKRWSGPEARLGREIGDFLEDVGLQERAAGGLISEQPNEDLFFLDRGSTPKRKKKPPQKLPQKPLHVDLVLQPLSKVPPPKKTPPQRQHRLLRGGRRRRDPRDPSKPPGDPSKPPGDSSKPPGDPSKLPGDPSKPPGGPLKPPGDPSKPPGDPSKPPGDPLKPPGDPSKPPGDPLKPPGDPSKPPGDPSKPPEDPLKPPRDPSKPPGLGRDPLDPPKPAELGRSDPHRGFYDIWGDNNPLDAPLAGQDPWYLQQTKRLRVQRPPRLQARPSPLPPVEVIGPGGSYNPPLLEHQELLRKALEVEMRRRREEEKVERRLKVTEEPPSQEAVLREQLQGLLEEDEEDEEEEEEGQQEDEEQQRPHRAQQPGWKTERQRRRDKENREKAAARARARLAVQRRQGLFQLRSLRRALRLRELRLRQRRLQREQNRKLRESAPKRLGRLRYEEPELELQLSEEIPESLRGLRPEGSVLRDRFRSLQRRNILEPRLRAKFKRRYRVKYVEKRAFRAVTL